MTRAEALLREVYELESSYHDRILSLLSTDDPIDYDAFSEEFHAYSISVVEKYQPILGNDLAAQAVNIFYQMDSLRNELVKTALNLDKNAKEAEPQVCADNVLQFCQKGGG